MKSKIIFFLLLTIALSGIIGCSEKMGDNLKDKHVIPYVPVETEINLNYADFNHLKSPLGTQYLSTSYPLGKKLGYQGNGILVFNVNGNEYKCWDATCTRCLETGVHLEIEGTDAICPTCSTKFSLNYGQPWNNGTEKLYPLKEYPVTIAGKTLRIKY